MFIVLTNQPTKQQPNNNQQPQLPANNNQQHPTTNNNTKQTTPPTHTKGGFLLLCFPHWEVARVEWIRAIQRQIAKKSHLAGWFSSHPTVFSTLGGCQGGVDQSNPEADCKENHTWQGGFLPSYCIFHPGRLPGWSGSEQSRGRLQGKSHLAEWYSSYCILPIPILHKSQFPHMFVWGRGIL